MARMRSEATNGVGSVRAGVSLLGENIHGGNQHRNKTEFSPVEKSLSSKARELHLANRDIGRFSDCKSSAEDERGRAESELSKTRKTLTELRSQIEESNAKARAHQQEVQLLKESERLEDEQAMARGKTDESKHMELMKELESLKKELSKLKLDMPYAYQVKANAEKEIEASSLRTATYMNSLEELTKEIEKVNEEHVLVEIARLEAVREKGEIEAQREAETLRFAKDLKQARAGLEEMTREIDQGKSLEQDLATTNADLKALQCEMELVRAMVKNSGPTSIDEEDKRTKEEMERDEESLRSAKAELEAAKKELVSVKDEGFQLMASMDAVREELKRISREAAQLKKLEEKQDLAIQSLNSKLLRARFKMEVATTSKENARAIITNLSAALQQLRSEADAAKKEKELIDKEIEITRVNMTKADSEVGLAERRLEATMQELERVKASEVAALDKLKVLSERAVKARASSAQRSSVIRISGFEYEYLMGHAEGAQKIADKKVAAAEAWVEALKASEEEMLMKIEVAQREIRELEDVESKELNRMENSLAMEKALEVEISKFGQQEREANATSSQPVATPRKPLKESGAPATPKRSRSRRRSLAHGTRPLPRSPSVTLKRRKVMPGLVKFLRGRRTAKHK